MSFIRKYWGIQLFCLISRSNVVLESLKSSIGWAFLLQLFEGKTRLHARHAARSPALVRTLMGQSETLLFFFAETNLRQSCFRVPQSSSLPGRHAQKSSWGRDWGYVTPSACASQWNQMWQRQPDFFNFYRRFWKAVCICLNLNHRLIVSEVLWSKYVDIY